MQSIKHPSILIPSWLVWVIALIMVGVGLGSYPILDNNEGLYAEIPREMLASGDWHAWIIPRLNGLVYMEKPPLLYWLTALCFAVFGESEWSARLVPALSCLSCVGLLMWFARRQGYVQTGRLAALMFATALGGMIMARTLMFDMLLTACLSASLAWAYIFVVENERRALRWSLAFLALALMTKGFIAVVLYCAVMGSFLMTQSLSVSDFGKRLWRWFDWRGLSIFLAIAAPWHVLASGVEPIFAWFYFINEHVLRFMGRREPHDYYAGPWWYYLPRIVIFLFPWSILLMGLMFAKPVGKHASPSVLIDTPAKKSLQWFLSLAWLMPLLFFSISSAKANYYLVTVLPFAAMQCALIWECRQFGGSRGRLMSGLILSLLLVILALSSAKFSASLAGFSVGGMPGDRFLSLSLLACTCASVIATAIAWRMPRIGVTAYVVVPLCMLVILLSVMAAVPQLVSTQPIADQIRSQYANRMVFSYKAYEEKSSLVFYLKTPINILESRSADLFWGDRLYKNSLMWHDAEFEALTRKQAIVIMVLDRDRADFEAKNYALGFRQTVHIGQVSLFINSL